MEVTLRTEKLDLEHLPLQSELIRSVCSAFMVESDVVAAVLLGSLAAGKGDRVSDADILILRRTTSINLPISASQFLNTTRKYFTYLTAFTMIMLTLKSISSMI